MASDALADNGVSGFLDFVLEHAPFNPSGAWRRIASVVRRLVLTPPLGSEAIHDLTYDARKRWHAKHAIPRSVALLCFHSNTASVASPFFATAQYLHRRYGHQSDGMVIGADAEVPRADVVRYAGELDHIGAVLPSVRSLGAAGRAISGPSGGQIAEALLNMMAKDLGGPSWRARRRNRRR